MIAAYFLPEASPPASLKPPKVIFYLISALYEPNLPAYIIAF